MRERMTAWGKLAREFWAGATPGKRLLVAGVPAVIVALVASGAIVAAFTVGGDDEKQAVAPTATPRPNSPTPRPSTPTSVPTPTETPASAGLQGSDYQGAPSRGGGGGGGGGGAVLSGGGGTGPGPITATDIRLSIPSIGVNATVYGRTVGTNGQMGNPAGAWDVIWYDFSQAWVGLGGYPGDPGANVVMAGHVDYIGVGPAVFWGLRNLQPGAIITITSRHGTINYAVQWSTWASPSADFSQYVTQTGVDSVTLVTCIGGFSGGHYSDRLVVRATRV
jgi:hypothetical protein